MWSTSVGAGPRSTPPLLSDLFPVDKAAPSCATLLTCRSPIFIRLSATEQSFAVPLHHHRQLKRPLLKVSVSEVKPGSEDRLRSWLRELDSRGEEVRETFEQETVRQEQAYLIDGARGLLLVYVSVAEDHERARSAFEASTLPIDAEHAAVMEAVIARRLDVAPIFDCSASSP